MGGIYEEADRASRREVVHSFEIKRARVRAKREKGKASEQEVGKKREVVDR